MERDMKETRQAKKEKETGRQRLRSLNLDEENIIKYTLRKHVVMRLRIRFSCNKYCGKFLEKTERQWTPKQEDFSMQLET